jgi:hypothetical protein
MLKNFILLGLLTWVSLTFARKDDFIVHDSISEAESYKVEKAVPEQEAKRSVAGSKIKKKSKDLPSDQIEKSSETDSEVRYWEYSE